MTKQQHIDSLAECKNIEEAGGIQHLSENDFDLTLKEVDEIRDECVEVVLKFKLNEE